MHRTNLKNAFRIAALIFFSAALASGPLSAENTDKPEKSPPKKDAATDAKTVVLGRKLYESHCIACHGKDGKGNGDAAIALPERPSDLTDIKEESDEHLFSIVTRGRRPMPKFGKLLTDDQRHAIVKYIRTFTH